MSLLTLPAPDPALRLPFEARPKALAQWLEHLPFASPLDAGQLLATALHGLNRLTLDLTTRQDLLLLFHPAVMRAAANLEPLMTDAGVPPLAQQRQASTLLRTLMQETCVAYKGLLQGLTSQHSGRGHARRQAEFSARLMAALRDWMAACYLGYGTPPAGLWHEMHSLYRSVQAAGMSETESGDTVPASVAYRQTLLLALADPPRMNRSEFLHTQYYLDQLARLAQLHPAARAPDTCGFAVPANSDRSPAQADGTDAPLWLDTDALCRALHDALIRMRTGESPRRIGFHPAMEGELSLTLGKRLLMLWRTGAKRGFQRYPADGTAIEVVAGVSAIHRLLDNALLQAAAPQDEDPDSALIADTTPIGAGPAKFFTSLWTLRNDSATGLALSATPDAPLNLKVGDALALRPRIEGDAEPDEHWSLAVIRWVRMDDTRRVELGIERLSPMIQPVWVRPLRGRHKGSPEPALYVPAERKQPDRLLLPRLVYQSGMDAELWHPPRQYLLTFGRRLEHTSSFDLIDFTLFASENSADGTST